MFLNKKIAVGLIFFGLSLFVFAGQSSAYTVNQINNATFKFDKKDASSITMKIGSKELKFSLTKAPNLTGNGDLFTIEPTSYYYELQSPTDDGCESGNVFSNGTTTVGQAYKANIKIPSENINNGPANQIDGSLTFFSKDGSVCSAKDIDSNIKVANSFGNNLKVADDKKITATADDLAGPSDSCVATDSGPLGWVICPIIDLASTFSQGVYKNFIQPFLEDVPVSTNPDEGVYKAWQSFRLIGNIVLVGTMLAVVYAQIKGDR